MINSYIKLLEEAKELLVDMYRVADDSVADYIIQIQTCINFIDKALETEDRLDIFRALQKIYDTLEKEYDEDEYGDIVDRIERALNGLHENIISKSDLKKLTKFVLTEIAAIEQKPTNFLDFLEKQIRSQSENNPVFNDISKAHYACKKNIYNMIQATRIMIQSNVKDLKKESNIAAHSFSDNGTTLMEITIDWAQKMDEITLKSKRGEIDRIMNKIPHHLIEIKNSLINIKNEISKHQNYILAMEIVKDMNLIFQTLNEDVDDLFELGLKYGLGKKK